MISSSLPKHRPATLSDYNIQSNSELYLVEKKPMITKREPSNSNLVLFVKVQDTSRVYKVAAKPSDTIGQIKNAIRKNANIPEPMQHLIWHGVELEDSLQLAFYDIVRSKKQATLTLVVTDTIHERITVVKKPLDEKGNLRRVQTNTSLSLNRSRSNAIYDDMAGHQSVFSSLGRKPQPLLVDKYNPRCWDLKRKKTLNIFIGTVLECAT
jgi:hypothetical protein